MLARQKEPIKWRSQNNFPQSQLRQAYSSWIDLYVLCIELLKRKSDLQAEREVVRKLPRALNSIKRTFFASKKDFDRQNIKELQTFITANAGVADPVPRLKALYIEDFLRIPRFTLQEWEQAFTELEPSWPKDALTDSAKKSNLKSIDKKIRAVDAELAKYPDLAKWQEFVSHWAEMQASCDGPITPQGFPLRSSPVPDEIEAFRKLGLGQLVDEKNRYHPASVT